jgi:hypothetical protein
VIRYGPGEGSATELGLNEELGIEDSRGGVERRTAVLGVDIVSSSHRVAVSRKRQQCQELSSIRQWRTACLRRKHPDGLQFIELTGVVRASKNLVDSVCKQLRVNRRSKPNLLSVELTERLRDKTIRSSLGRCKGVI